MDFYEKNQGQFRKSNTLVSLTQGFGCPPIHTIYTEMSALSTLEKLLTFWKHFIPESHLRTEIKTLKNLLHIVNNLHEFWFCFLYKPNETQPLSAH